MDMPNSQNSEKLNALLEHSGWVRTLARSLVADPATADDVEQKAWVAALEHSGTIRNPRSWFTGVMRNLVGMHWRERKARNRREEKVGTRRAMELHGDSAMHKPGDISQRRETFRILAVAMGKLEEPYGTVMYLRFFEKLTMREIAFNMNAPESTTKARVIRGLEMLRQELESSLGRDWRPYCLALSIPLPSLTLATAATSFILVMKTKAFLATASVLLLSLVLWQPWGGPPNLTIDKSDQANALVAITKSEKPGLDDMQAVGLTRKNLDQQTAETPLPAQEETKPLLIHVVEAENGLPVLGAHVDIWNVGKGTTDAHGIIRFQIPKSSQKADIQLTLNDGESSFKHRDIFKFKADAIALERTLIIPKRYHFTLIAKSPDGACLASQEITVSNDTHGTDFRSDQSYLTDENGEVNLAYLEGYFHVKFGPVPEGMFPIAARLNLKAENDGQSQVLTLLRSRKIQVTVFNPNHEVLSNAEVTAGSMHQVDLAIGSFVPGENSRQEPSLTGQDGTATLLVPKDEELWVDANHPEYSYAFLRTSSTQQNASLVLQPATGFQGVVRDQKGEVVVNAEVRIWSGHPLGGSDSPDRPSDWKISKTDHAGRFKSSFIEEKHRVWIFVKSEGFAYFGKRWNQPPEDQQEVVLNPPAPLFGFVVDEEGHPVEGITVEVSGEPAFGQVTPWQTLSYYAETYRQVTKQDGSFSFPGISAGSYRLKLWGGLETLQTVHTGPDPIYMTDGALDPGLMVVEFQVLDSVSRKPIPGANLSNSNLSEKGLFALGIGETNANGILKSHPIERDDGFFQVTAKGYVPNGTFKRAVQDGRSHLTFLLEPSVSRPIRLIAVDGKPLLSHQESASLRAAIVRDHGFLLYRMLVPAPESGVGPFHNRFKDNVTLFQDFPASGGTVRIEVGAKTSPEGVVTPEKSIEVAVPAGELEYSVILTLQQLKDLGLRE